VKVPCPTCRRETEWSSDNRYRPYCSERCKMVDLGAWFAEERSIPAEAPSERDADPADEPTQRD
jgi:endogenous inhibitor of DNA gyrase (YacG/DUF329 family)